MEFFWLLHNGGKAALSLCLLTLCLVALTEGGKGSITLNSIAVSPNPSSIFDILTVTADGEDVNYYDTNPDTVFAASGGANPNGWNCITVESDITGDINHIDLDFINSAGIGDCGGVTGAAVLEYVSAVKSGEIYAYETGWFGGSPPGEWCRSTSDLNSFQMQAGTTYWLCIKTAAQPWPLDTDTTETRIWLNAITDPFGDFAGYTDRSSEGIPLFYPVLKTYSPTQLTVINPGGNYASDYLCKGGYSDANENSFCSFSNPCQAGNCTIKGKIYSEESGWSSEAQATINIGEAPIQANAGLPIYVYATYNWGQGLNEKIRLHSPNYFSARPAGAYIGRIEIDGEVVQTCNNTWECQNSIETGTHVYNLYSAIGSYKYSGVFTIDLNSTEVRIYVPMSYTLFDIFTSDSTQTLLGCSSINSLNVNDTIDEAGKITTYVNDGGCIGCLTAFDSNSVIPRNCYHYGGNNINDLYAFAIAAPTSVNYADDTPADDELDASEGVWQKALGGLMAGTGQDRQGYITKAILYEDSAIAYDGTFTKIYEQPGGYYSMLTDFIHPSMNEETYFLLDANYYPGSVAIGDNLYCEVRLQSHNFVINDINILVVANGDTIVDSYATTLYRQFYSNMEDQTASSIGNLVYHKFEDVDPGAAGIIQCAFQTTNSLGVKSGWAFSKQRAMHATRTSAAGGVNIFVKDESGTTSYLRHKSQATGDENNFDLFSYGFEPDIITQYDTADNPLAIPSGSSFALTQDRNATSKTWVAGKSFYVNIAGSFDVSLYLPDVDTTNQFPIISSIQIEQNTETARFTCKAEYYDKDLDVNQVIFNFWTDSGGSSIDPVCFKDGATYTTNCGLENTSIYYSIPANKCLATRFIEYSQIGFYSECGSDNDCIAEASFEYINCVPGGSLNGYCQVAITDSNNNTAYNLANIPIAPQIYNPNAECTIYNYPSNESEDTHETYGHNMIYSGFPSFVECGITVDEVLTPDFNFSAVFLGTTLTYWKSEYNEYRGQTTRYFKGETTQAVETFLAENGYINDQISVSRSVWDRGDLRVEINHPVYGYFIGSLDATLISGIAVPGAPGSSEYSEQNVDVLYNWMDVLLMDFMTDPIGAIPRHFFEVVVIVILIVILGPLLIYEARKEIVNVKVTNRK